MIEENSCLMAVPDVNPHGSHSPRDVDTSDKGLEVVLLMVVDSQRTLIRVTIPQHMFPPCPLAWSASNH